jgi:hypothetical protein
MTLEELYIVLTPIIQKHHEDGNVNAFEIHFEELAVDTALCYFMHALQRAVEGRPDLLLAITMNISALVHHWKSEHPEA